MLRAGIGFLPEDRKRLGLFAAMNVVAACSALAAAFTPCLDIRTALGGSFATFSAQRFAAASASPSGTTSSQRPQPSA